ncbi:MAG: hypothetical protein G3M78_01020 [Candidatus Nitrohelix vancouverensis]|uniref:Gamma-glutamyl-gamma-aminobutyrate hydrolase n=1 Tax=Candidatus Nitrohelix vancouverensis TaxID=2705534 RepID=A0A7T0C024_9BACT|nr:MAG: hypothetical protein G3M78_01020 [Candidatus Nitrohelix vancouverensis]
MRKVLVSQRLDTIEAYGEVRESLDIRWGELLPACGVIPVPCPSKFPPEQFFRAINPQGLLLTGGNDTLQFAPDDSLSRLRQMHEFALLELALSRKLPIMGVCHGMQIIAEYFNFTMQRIDKHVAIDHPISIEASSFLSRFLGKESVVNSFHNNGIVALNPQFTASARHTGDQTIEAFESLEHNIIGIMWHPERNKAYRESDIKLIHNFFTNVSDKWELSTP